MRHGRLRFSDWILARVRGGRALWSRRIRGNTLALTRPQSLLPAYGGGAALVGLKFACIAHWCIPAAGVLPALAQKRHRCLWLRWPGGKALGRKLAIRRSAPGQGTPALGAAGSIGANLCLTSPADVRLPCWRQRLGVSEVTERGGGSEPGATRNGGKASLDTTTDQQPSVTGFAKLGRDASSGNRVLGLFPSFWGVGKVRRRASWKGVDQEEAPLSRQTAGGCPSSANRLPVRAPVICQQKWKSCLASARAGKCRLRPLPLQRPQGAAEN